jgi:enoyl-CoA hydratase/carnithine racemase
MPEMGFAAYPGAAGPSTQITLTRKRAAWMILTAERIDGDTAERWGLVNRSVPLSELEAEADKLARRVAGFDRTALIAAKRALDAVPGRMSDWTEIFDFGIDVNDRIRRDTGAQDAGIGRFSEGVRNPGQGSKE